MSKPYYEVAAEIVQETLKARANAIAGMDYVQGQKDLIETTLSDSAVTALYESVYKALNQTR